MTRRQSIAAMLAGALLLLAAAGWSSHLRREDRAAGESARQILYEIQANPAVAAPAASPEEESAAALPFGAIGALAIPSLGLELPVLDQCSDELLKLSVCRYSGQPGERLVVAGHNYASHFKKIPDLLPGDEILFSGSSGTATSYRVTGTETIGADDHDALDAGESDLTLFTCNFNNSKRILIRCVAD